MAKGNPQLLFASPDAIATMPHGFATGLAAQLDAYGISIVVVDPAVAYDVQVEDAQRAHNRIIGFIGRTEQDIVGMKAATINGGLALSVGGPASVWCAREEGRSFAFGRCREVSQASDAIHAIQSAVGGS